VNATIEGLTLAEMPWSFALRLHGLESEAFWNFIADLKTGIPSRSRRWDADNRRWLLRADVIESVAVLLNSHGLTYEHTGAGESEVHSGAVLANPYHALHLLPTAPPELVRAAYRLLAKRHHPDGGGSHAAMQELGQAYQRIIGAGV